MEYEALGVDFADRGKRLDEQIALLRRLWTERSVSFSGRFHTVDRRGTSATAISVHPGVRRRFLARGAVQSGTNSRRLVSAAMARRHIRTRPLILSGHAARR